MTRPQYISRLLSILLLTALAMGNAFVSGHYHEGNGPEPHHCEVCPLNALKTGAASAAPEPILIPMVATAQLNLQPLATQGQSLVPFSPRAPPTSWI